MFSSALIHLSADSKEDSADISVTESKSFVKAIIFSVLAAGHSANSAHPRNFFAASSKLMGFAGLPLPKSARPAITAPFFKWIFRIEVILRSEERRVGKECRSR